MADQEKLEETKPEEESEDEDEILRQILSSSKIRRLPPEPEEEEDTRQYVKVDLPRASQAAPQDELKEASGLAAHSPSPVPRVVIHKIDVEEPPSSKTSKPLASSEASTDDLGESVEIRNSVENGDSVEVAASEEPASSVPTYPGSASREPLVTNNPELSREERIKEVMGMEECQTQEGNGDSVEVAASEEPASSVPTYPGSASREPLVTNNPELSREERIKEVMGMEECQTQEGNGDSVEVAASEEPASSVPTYPGSASREPLVTNNPELSREERIKEVMGMEECQTQEGNGDSVEVAASEEPASSVPTYPGSASREPLVTNNPELSREERIKEVMGMEECQTQEGNGDSVEVAASEEPASSVPTYPGSASREPLVTNNPELSREERIKEVMGMEECQTQEGNGDSVEVAASEEPASSVPTYPGSASREPLVTNNPELSREERIKEVMGMEECQTQEGNGDSVEVAASEEPASSVPTYPGSASREPLVTNNPELSREERIKEVMGMEECQTQEGNGDSVEVAASEEPASSVPTYPGSASREPLVTNNPELSREERIKEVMGMEECQTQEGNGDSVEVAASEEPASSVPTYPGSASREPLVTNNPELSREERIKEVMGMEECQTQEGNGDSVEVAASEEPASSVPTYPGSASREPLVTNNPELSREERIKEVMGMEECQTQEGNGDSVEVAASEEPASSVPTYPGSASREPLVTNNPELSREERIKEVMGMEECQTQEGNGDSVEVAASEEPASSVPNYPGSASREPLVTNNPELSREERIKEVMGMEECQTQEGNGDSVEVAASEEPASSVPTYPGSASREPLVTNNPELSREERIKEVMGMEECQTQEGNGDSVEVAASEEPASSVPTYPGSASREPLVTNNPELSREERIKEVMGMEECQTQEGNGDSVEVAASEEPASSVPTYPGSASREPLVTNNPELSREERIKEVMGMEECQTQEGNGDSVEVAASEEPASSVPTYPGSASREPLVTNNPELSREERIKEVMGMEECQTQEGNGDSVEVAASEEPASSVPTYPGSASREPLVTNNPELSREERIKEVMGMEECQTQEGNGDSVEVAASEEPASSVPTYPGSASREPLVTNNPELSREERIKEVMGMEECQTQEGNGDSVEVAASEEPASSVPTYPGSASREPLVTNNPELSREERIKEVMGMEECQTQEGNGDSVEVAASEEPASSVPTYPGSASREPLVTNNPELSREERIKEHTAHKLWEVGEAEELFPAPAKCYTCRFCGLSYAYMTTLKAHERVHDVDEPYRCAKCNHSFRFYSEYDYHMRSHTEQKQYKCKCKRSFSLYTDLINHKCEIDCFLDEVLEPPAEPIHPPLKESALMTKPKAQPLYRYPDSRRKCYICQYCGKSYAESRDLKYHMYSHRGEKVFNVRSTSYQKCLDRDKIWKSDLDYYDWGED